MMKSRMNQAKTTNSAREEPTTNQMRAFRTDLVLASFSCCFVANNGTLTSAAPAGHCWKDQNEQIEPTPRTFGLERRVARNAMSNANNAIAAEESADTEPSGVSIQGVFVRRRQDCKPSFNCELLDGQLHYRMNFPCSVALKIGSPV
jgi:hypothetical protein